MLEWQKLVCSKVFSAYCILHPSSASAVLVCQSQTDLGSNTAFHACHSIPTGSAPCPGNPADWPGSMYSYDTAVYWIILLDEDHCLGSGTKTVISLRGRSILAAEAHQSHKLELLWNREGASTGLPDIQVLETACKSAQAVVVWSQLLQRQQLCCFQWWIHSESKTALVVIRCTILG